MNNIISIRLLKNKSFAKEKSTEDNCANLANFGVSVLVSQTDECGRQLTIKGREDRTEIVQTMMAYWLWLITIIL
jgi:hypothetical protein